MGDIHDERLRNGFFILLGTVVVTLCGFFAYTTIWGTGAPDSTGLGIAYVLGGTLSMLGASIVFLFGVVVVVYGLGWLTTDGIDHVRGWVQ